MGKTLILRTKDSNGDTIVRNRFTITAYTSATVVTVRAVTIVPDVLRDTATKHWVFAVTQISGLDHLEGKEVAVFADADVINGITVTSGAIALSKPVGKAHIGLPYTSDMQILPVELSEQGVPSTGKPLSIPKIHVQIKDSRGLSAGNSEDNLFDLLQRDTEGWGESIKRDTGTFSVPIAASAEEVQQIFIRQSQPLPLHVLVYNCGSGGKPWLMSPCAPRDTVNYPISPTTCVKLIEQKYA